MAFAHLHLHTEYSLLDGACRIERLLDTAKELGQTAVAITDHGCMYGVVDFYKAAKARGIKPIIGCEVYVAKRTRFDRVHELDAENRHLVLLCENETGYKNLIKMVSLAWVEGFYNRPRIDFDLLEENHEGLIALSACLAGEIPRALEVNDYDGAKAAALNYDRIFGRGNFFLELQDHGLPEQKRVNPGIMRIARETGIPLVVTNDCHYIKKEDSKMHHVLVCIQTNKTIDDEDTLEFGSEEFYLKSEEEMRALFPELPEAADNTMKIAQRCCFDFEFGKTKLPRFDTPDGSENREYFIKKCYDGLHAHYGEKPKKEIVERLEYELKTISDMGYVNYYLIVHDFIRQAKSLGIPVGPGRGSGVGSLAAYCIGITGVDPLKYDLIFERFLNPERVSMPDFDIDFSDERRQEIIDYVVEKYGSDHVAQIVTFGTMAARQALRDVGRAMGISYAKVDSVAKLVPSQLKMTLDRALEESPDFAERYKLDAEVRELVDMARKVEGMPRHASTHAAGVVITDKPVMEYVPLSMNDESVVTQFTMTTIEELGLLKMDFLGLRNLSVIENAEKLIKKREPGFVHGMMDGDDPRVFDMIDTGATEGVFQFESAGMKRLIIQAQPRSVEDLTAIISLYRPGPMQFIPMYIENKNDRSKIKYRHERLKSILGVTYGCIIYQEQVMTIFRELAGYSLGRADIVRRAMSKKKHDVLEREREIFINGLEREDGTVEIEGCVRRGVDKKTAAAIFKEIESFASYAFNKSHAAAYATLSYQTAYLKCLYPREYMAALLSSVLGSSSKVADYIEECERLSIKILPPHVNQSENDFSVVGKDIRFGLLAVKNLGRGAIAYMLEERGKNGEYKSFFSFCKRTHSREVNKRAVESLIKCGALDGLGSNRREMLSAFESVMDSLEDERKNNVEGQLGFFDDASSSVDEMSIPHMEEYSAKELLAMEKETTGMYLSGHPMAVFSSLYRSGKFARTDAILKSAEGESDEYKDEQRVKLLVMITALKRKVTKNGSNMAFATLEDIYGSIEMLVFPATLESNRDFIAEGAQLVVSGRISFTEEKEPKIICENLAWAPKPDGVGDAPVQKENEHGAKCGLYIKVRGKDDSAYLKALKYIEVFDGNSNLYVFFEDSGKLLRAPSRYMVQINDVLLDALRELLGEKNVAVK